MSAKGLKILLGKPGLDGHDVGVKVLAHALIDEGFQVHYSGLRKPIEAIVKMAVEKKVDVIGLSILSGTHLVLCEQMREEMKNNDLSIPWIVGGNIPDDDVEAIKALGAEAAFATGTSIEEVIGHCNQLAEKRKRAV
jgi:methylmalonyl-CoA mutase C-terminal domain/subunit